MPAIILKPRRSKPPLFRHPWVLDTAIERIEGQPADGDVVDLLSGRGEFIARGIFNSRSRIQVRLYTWEAHEALDEAFWRRRLAAAWALRKDLGYDDPQGAARMAFSEGDGLSGLVVDRYGEVLVVQVTALAMAVRLETLVPLLVEQAAPRAIVLRSERDIVRAEGLEVLGPFVVPPLGGMPPEGGTTNSVPPEGGTTNSIPPEGGTTNSIPPEGGTTNSIPPEGGTTNSVPPEGGTTNSIPPEGGTTNSVPPEGGTTNSIPPEGGTTNSIPPEGGTTNSVPPEGGTTNSIPPEGGTTNSVPPEGGTTNRAEIRQGLRWGQLPDGPVPIREGGLWYEVDPAAGQKTGFYLDQRENRAAAARYLRGRRVLDMFCYTGGFALAAAAGGAREVLGVDTSQRAVERAAEGARRNGLQNVRFEPGEAFQTLERLRHAGERFEAVVLDPPRFARSRHAVDEALRAYHRLNRLAVDLLAPGGILVTCSCSGHVSREDFLGMLRGVARAARRDVQLLEARGAAPDHPVSASCPETEYLKCFICRVG